MVFDGVMSGFYSPFIASITNMSTLTVRERLREMYRDSSCVFLRNHIVPSWSFAKSILYTR